MIEIDKVSKSFEQKKGTSYQALDEVSFTIKQGEFVSLLGPSGCGKSTLLNLIAGFEKAYDGTIRVNGEPVKGPGAGKVVVFQEHGLFPWLNVLDNVAFGLKQQGVPKKERHARALEGIKSVHLSKFIDRYPHELSGGMKQRVAIARALVMEPDILLMDEPFAALDEQTRYILQKDLEDIWLRTRKTVLFITHNIREAVLLSDRVLVMSTQPGRIKKEFAIQAARPHQAGDPLIHHYENKIMETLSEELEKVVREEMGHDYRIAKNAVPDLPDRNLGIGI
ncbi:ABC transporter ATP-binding protein [Paenibacillus glycinis]|uniref:ATP-binding cassette domain-containing protein n=1 Tax=Paenibacillus glycinis TaxID=2697035 RepID=A0ABW9XMU7_9BACL|nr:ABC transporter ATP-binding protein [Paenibacillus glycinis]NBD23963.1 ATP-binding cassette domain-containing protein [Paenibacillus glycinis]